MLGCRVSAWLMVVVLACPTLAGVCPESCVCQTSEDGLHKATCSSVADLYKFTIRQRHHNINILDLSHNNITKLTYELDRLTEVVTLDLSTNGLVEIKKFLHNAKKLVHLNLAHNRIASLSLTNLPVSLSSLDLSSNLLRNVPHDVDHLKSLEHLELQGNPLDCSCENIQARDKLLLRNILIDDVKCKSPENLKDKSWLKLKTKELCKIPKSNDKMLDMMMGDQPVDATKVGEDAAALKFSGNKVLEDLKIPRDSHLDENDDLEFIKVNHRRSLEPTIEGSGYSEGDTGSDTLRKKSTEGETESITADPYEGSGFSSEFEGSGFGWKDETTVETTTEFIELFTGPIVPLITDETNMTEFPSPPPATVFAGGPNWHLDGSEAPLTTELAIKIEETTPVKPVIDTVHTSTNKPFSDTTVSEKIRVTQAAEIVEQPTKDEKIAPHRAGTYVCIAIIVVLLISLVGYAIVKGQIRKRRDRRLIRQQKRDIEQASKEMVDMNKSLLGKPAMLDSTIDKKLNGKYELVPTHERKGENGGVGNGLKNTDNNGIKSESPRDTNQNKNSSKDNNKEKDNLGMSSPKDTSFDSVRSSVNSGKDNNSLSSEDIFPANIGGVRLNGTVPESELSQPLLQAGDSLLDPNFLLPQEYTPVYSPDSGRVRIKLSETPKPKTPVLVTRSRSNAGDIIITPTADVDTVKSST